MLGAITGEPIADKRFGARDNVGGGLRREADEDALAVRSGIKQRLLLHDLARDDLLFGEVDVGECADDEGDARHEEDEDATGHDTAAQGLARFNHHEAHD